jgi:hypothetical protein
MENPYVFSVAFGLADTRENCIESAQELYKRLLARTPFTDSLSFETLALVAVNKDGSLDEQKLKELIRVLRPDRDGDLSMLDFVKSVDEVYKEFRLLRASVKNSQKLDHAFENLLNIFFYTILFAVVCFSFGLDPLVSAPWKNVGASVPCSSPLYLFAFPLNRPSSCLYPVSSLVSI